MTFAVYHEGSHQFWVPDNSVPGQFILRAVSPSGVTGIQRMGWAVYVNMVADLTGPLQVFARDVEDAYPGASLVRVYDTHVTQVGKLVGCLPANKYQVFEKSLLALPTPGIYTGGYGPDDVIGGGN